MESNFSKKAEDEQKGIERHKKYTKVLIFNR
jgi:hypothetical protein